MSLLLLFNNAPQKGRPTSDITAGTWTPSTGATLFGTLDEVTPDDTDYDQSALSPASADIMEVKLSAMTDPVSSVNHFVSYRYEKLIPATLGTGNRIDLTVRLRQGTTNLVSWTHTDIGAVTQATQTLSGAVSDSITDYSDLRVRFEAVKV